MPSQAPALVALVPTAVLVDGVRTVIQPGQPLPALSASDSLALQHGKAAQPAATVADPPVYGAAHAPQAAEAPDAPEVQDTQEAPDAQPAPSAAPAPPIATTTKPSKAPAKAKKE